ncbi:hypothetical protein IP86_23225 [Rhodopseudomonas sp. AAP120]|nr:hypothetical protein IP86_23225 [Rhodopseudomonas sp. AAP120]
MPVPVRAFLRLAIALGAAAALMIPAAGPAGAQQPPAPPAAPSPASPPPPPRENPGLVDELGKLLKTPGSLLPSWSWPDSKPDAPAAPPEAAAPPAAVAPPAAAPASPPPPAAAASPLVPAMVDGRQVCPSTANGASDCAAAATILCRAKGYQQGRSLGVDATEKCSAKVLIPGRTREPGDCRTENFVTRAWCQ